MNTLPSGRPALDTTKPLAIAVMAMGGQGGGVLVDWIVELCETQNWVAQSTSVPGVAQRTGETVFFIEALPQPQPAPKGRKTVLWVRAVPAEVDVVIGAELMEAGRAIQRGLVTPDRTTLIASTHRVYSMTEKTVIADGQVDSSKLLDACFGAAKEFVRADFAAMAND